MVKHWVGYLSTIREEIDEVNRQVKWIVQLLFGPKKLEEEEEGRLREYEWVAIPLIFGKWVAVDPAYGKALGFLERLSK